MREGGGVDEGDGTELQRTCQVRRACQRYETAIESEIRKYKGRELPPESYFRSKSCQFRSLVEAQTHSLGLHPPTTPGCDPLCQDHGDREESGQEEPQVGARKRYEVQKLL